MVYEPGIMTTKCPNCEGPTGLYYSDEVIALYHRIQNTENPDQRVALMEEMSNLFAEENDPTDQYIDEYVHHMVEEVIKASAIHYQRSMELARTLLREMDADPAINAPEEPTPPKKNEPIN